MRALNVFYELLKFLRDVLRTIISNNPWFFSRVFILGCLNGKLNVIACHIMSQFMMNNVAAKSINDRNKKQECADRKSTRLNSSHLGISYAVFCLKKTIRLGV